MFSLRVFSQHCGQEQLNLRAQRRGLFIMARLSLSKPSCENTKMGKGILLGWDQKHREPIGFVSPLASSEPQPFGLVSDSMEGHLCCVAPTRAGKSLCSIVPNLLNYQGAAIILDPKGEHAIVTARRRREMMQSVYLLDPTHHVTDEPATLNPLDVLQLPGADLETDSFALAEMLVRGYRGTKEPFWDLHGSALLAALIICAATDVNPVKRTLKTVLEILGADDVSYLLATILDSRKDLNRCAYQTIASILQLPDVTRGGVIASTQAYVKPLMSESVVKSLGQSTIPLLDLISGKPMSIYFVLPPHRLPALRGLLKVQLGTLMTALLIRRERPELPTWLVLDEVGQLETFPILENLLTMSAGYAVKVAMYWQDLAQMVSYYPESWRTILNNCSVLQAFGIYNRVMANQWGDYMDISPSELLRMRSNEQVLSIHNRGTFCCKRLNYLRDFAPDQFDEHPMHRTALNLDNAR